MMAKICINTGKKMTLRIMNDNHEGQVRAQQFSQCDMQITSAYHKSS